MTLDNKVNIPKIYKLPDNFNVNKKSDDNTTVSVSEAVSQRVTKVFRKNIGKIVLLTLITLPIFFITLPLTYLVIREGAEYEVADALARARLDMMGKGNGKENVILNALNNRSFVNYSPRSQQEAHGCLLTEINHSDIAENVKKFFTQKDISIMINNLKLPVNGESVSAEEIWREYEKKENIIKESIRKRKEEIQKISPKITDKEIEDKITKLIECQQGENRQRIMHMSSNESRLKAIKTIIQTETDLVNLFSNRNHSEIEKKLKKELKKVLIDNSDSYGDEINEKSGFNIDGGLPLYKGSLQDLSRRFSAHSINGSFYCESPSNNDIKEYVNSLNGDITKSNITKSSIEKAKIEINELLKPIKELYDYANQRLDKEDPENEKNADKLWGILQLALGQTMFNRSAKGLYGFIFTEGFTKLDPMEQSRFVEFNQNSDGSLSIIFKAIYGFKKTDIIYDSFYSLATSFEMRIKKEEDGNIRDFDIKLKDYSLIPNGKIEHYKIHEGFSFATLPKGKTETTSNEENDL